MIGRAIKLAGGELDKTVQATIHLQGSRLFKDPHHALIVGVSRRINGGCKRIQIDDQNMVLVITTIIVSGLRRHQISPPGVQVGPCSINAQLGFSTHPDDNLVVLMPVLMRGRGKLQKFRVNH